MWGSTDISSIELMEYLVSTNLDILNVGNALTIRGDKRAEMTVTSMLVKLGELDNMMKDIN